MIGRRFHESVYEKVENPGDEVMSLGHVSFYPERKHGGLKDVSITIHRGEIVGVAGIDGNGQSELIEAITGLRRVEKGKILSDILNVSNQVCCLNGQYHAYRLESK